MLWRFTMPGIQPAMNSCTFNDSILTDEEAERAQDRQDVNIGAMTLLEYRMKWYDEEEAVAKTKIVAEDRPALE